MFTKKLPDETTALADQAAASANEAIRATQRATNDALDGLASTVHDLRRQAVPLLQRASAQANSFLQQGMDAVQGGSHKVRGQARRASATTLNYVKDEPVKSLLIAAAVGAVLTSLVWLGNGSRSDRWPR